MKQILILILLLTIVSCRKETVQPIEPTNYNTPFSYVFTIKNITNSNGNIYYNQYYDDKNNSENFTITKDTIITIPSTEQTGFGMFFHTEGIKNSFYVECKFQYKDHYSILFKKTFVLMDSIESLSYMPLPDRTEKFLLYGKRTIVK